MRQYEITLVFRVDLEESQRNELLERIQALIPLVDDESVASLKVDHWGERDLAYPIKKQNKGYYVFISGVMNGDGLDEFERNVLYEENILRHLVIRAEE